MIETVIKALTEKDYKALASCFSENCTYFDYCPSLSGKPNSYIYGNACMEMYFRKQFVSQELEVAEPLIEGKDRASYFGSYGGPYIYSRISIEEYDNAGLIKKAIVHPA